MIRLDNDIIKIIYNMISMLCPGVRILKQNIETESLQQQLTDILQGDTKCVTWSWDECGVSRRESAGLNNR